MMKGTRNAPGRGPRGPKSKPKPVALPADPFVVLDIEFRRNPRNEELDLRLVVDKVRRPHILRIEPPVITMPDGTTRICEFYNVSAAQAGRFTGHEFQGGLSVGSAFIIRDVPRRPASWKNTVLRYINSCCVLRKDEPTAKSLEERVARLEKEVARLSRRDKEVARSLREVAKTKKAT